MSGILSPAIGLLKKVFWGIVTILLLVFIYTAMVLIAIPTAISWLLKGREYTLSAVWKYEIYKNLDFKYSGGMAIGEDGRLYILDLQWHRIYRLSAEGKYQCDVDIWLPVRKVRNFVTYYIGLDAYGLEAYDISYPCHGEYDLEEYGLWVYPMHTISFPYFIDEKFKVIGLAKAPGGAVYALATDMRLVCINDKAQVGNDVIYIEPQEIAGIIKGIAIDNDGLIYICYDGRISRYDKNGRLLSHIDMVKDDTGDPLKLAGLSLSAGRIFVACEDTNEVLVLDDRLQKINSWKAIRGKKKAGIGLKGVATDKSGNVYVVGNWDSFKIKKYTRDGKFVTLVDAVKNINFALVRPYRIYVDRDDNILCLNDDSIAIFHA